MIISPILSEYHKPLRNDSRVASFLFGSIIVLSFAFIEIAFFSSSPLKERERETRRNNAINAKTIHVEIF